MKKLLAVIVITTITSCSVKREQKVKTLKNVDYTIVTTVLKDGTILSVVHNTKIKY